MVGYSAACFVSDYRHIIGRILTGFLATLLFGEGSAWALDGQVLYGLGGSNVPQRKIYTGSSTTFGAGTANNANATATVVQWVVLRDAPLRKEKMLGTLSSDGTMVFQEFNGLTSTWTTRRTCATCLSGGTADNFRAFDIAYEDSSSDALLVYETSTAANTTVSFARWDGITFTDNADGLDLQWTTATGTRWIQLVPRGGASDAVMLIAMTDDGQIRAVEWSGAAWGTPQELTTAGIAAAPGRPFDFRYEKQSGDGLAVYGTGTTLETWTRVTGTWAGPTTNSPFNPAAATDEIQMAADPKSDYVAFIMRDAGRDCNAFVWDGSAWEAGNPAEDAAIEQPSTTLPSRTVDVAWGKSNRVALFVLVDANLTDPDYFTYAAGGAGWNITSIATNAANTGTAWPDDVEMVQLTSSPNDNAIMLIGTSLPTGGNNIQARAWDGSTWSAPTNADPTTPIESSPSDDNFEVAMFAWDAPLPRLEQISYKVCDNTDAVQPTVCDAQNTARSGTDVEGVVRLRMGVKAIGDNLATGQTFKLQYASTDSTCTAASGYTDVGVSTAVDVAWRGYVNATPGDGDTVTANLLTGATALESYEEANDSAGTPNTISAGATGEWDWVIENYFAGAGQTYCFRMIRADDSTFNTYTQFPEITTAAGDAGGMILYGDGTAGTPKKQIWLTGSQDFDATETSANAGNASAIQFMIARSIQADVVSLPAGRTKELVIGSQHLDGSLLVQMWDGSAWTNWTPGISSIVPGANADAARGFDVGYESKTGDALVVYENNTSDQFFNYSVWDGTSWTSSSYNYTSVDCGGTPAAGNIRWMKLRPKPQSEEMILMFESAEGAAEALYAVHWNGSSWDNCLAAVDSTSCSGTIRECFDFSWERLTSGFDSQGVFVYDNGTDIAWRQFVFNTGWGGETAGAPCAGSVAGGTVQRVQMANDPTSNDLAIAVMYGAAPADLCADIWDGAAWLGTGPSPELGIESGVALGSRPMDVAWELNTGKAMFVYTEANTPNVEYFTYDRPLGTWSVASIDTNTTVASNSWPDDVYHLNLYPSPNGNQIMLVGISPESGLVAPGDIRTAAWNGGAWKESTNSLVDTDPSDLDSQPAAFVWHRKDATLVKLVSFRGIGYADRVELTWETAAERENAGFNVYRDQRPGVRVQVNKKMIQGLGTNMRGKKYVFIDSDLPPCSLAPDPCALFYWLEDIEFTGKRTYHGPAEVHVGRDGDGDGMVDAWETAHGLDPARNDSSEDADGDGISNLLEYLNGTLPNRTDSAVWITDLSVFAERGRARAGTTPASPSMACPARQEAPSGWRVARGQPGDLDLTCLGLDCDRAVLVAVPPSVHPMISLPNSFSTETLGVFRGEKLIKIRRNEDRLESDCLPVSIRISDLDSDVTDWEPTVRRPTPRLDSLVDGIATARLGRRTSGRPPTRLSHIAAELPQGSLWGVSTRETGIHRLSGEALRAGGLDSETFPPSELRMFTFDGDDWVEIPIQVRGGEDGRLDPDDAVLFYAPRDESKFSPGDVYLLGIGPGGKRIQIIDLPVTSTAPFASQTPSLVTFEEDHLYWPSLPDSAETADRWFFRDFATDETPREWTFSVPGLPGRDVDYTLSVTMAGAFDNPDVKIAHHVRVELNGAPLGILEWGGTDEFTGRWSIPAGVVRGSENRLRLVPLIGEGADFDRILLNRVQVQYRQSLRAVENEMSVVASGEKNMRVEGFSNASIQLWDISDPLEPVALGAAVEGDPATGWAALWGPRSGTQVALSEDRLKKTAEVFPVQTPPPADIGAGADLIVILPETREATAREAFASAIGPLVARREQEGLRVQVVNAEDLYWEFGDGRSNPHAIKTFLRHAFDSSPDPKPSYVLLVGDATYDYKGNEGPGAGGQGSGGEGSEQASNERPPATAYLPTYLLHTPIGGEVPSDAWYVSFDGAPFDKLRVSGDPLMVSGSESVRPEPFDTVVRPELVEGGRQAQGRPVKARGDQLDLFPDMAVGRLPARTPDELSTMVDKILHYADDDPNSEWRGNILLVADNIQDEFVGISESLFDLAPPTVFLTRAYLSLFPSPAGLTEGLVDELNSGSSLVNFVGHGSTQYWASEKVLGLNQLERLSNRGRYPVILSLTCINGYFVYPTGQDFESMAEEFVRAPEKGAVAFFAPSGMSSPVVQATLNRSLFKAIAQDRTNPIGAAILKAYLELGKEVPAASLEFVPQIYLLFGDPSMDILLPDTAVPERQAAGGGCSCSHIGAPGSSREGFPAFLILVGVILGYRWVRRRRV